MLHQLGTGRQIPIGTAGMAVPQIGRQDGQSLLEIVAGTIPAQQGGDRIAVAQVVNARAEIGVAGTPQADLTRDAAKNQMDRAMLKRQTLMRAEEQPSELRSLMRIPYAVYCI